MERSDLQLPFCMPQLTCTQQKATTTYQVTSAEAIHPHPGKKGLSYLEVGEQGDYKERSFSLVAAFLVVWYAAKLENTCTDLTQKSFDLSSKATGGQK